MNNQFLKFTTDEQTDIYVAPSEIAAIEEFAKESSVHCYIHLKSGSKIKVDDNASEIESPLFAYYGSLTIVGVAQSQ